DLVEHVLVVRLHVDARTVVRARQVLHEIAREIPRIVDGRQRRLVSRGGLRLQPGGTERYHARVPFLRSRGETVLSPRRSENGGCLEAARPPLPPFITPAPAQSPLPQFPPAREARRYALPECAASPPRARTGTGPHTAQA